jgi:cold shock CspA family protein
MAIQFSRGKSVVPVRPVHAGKVTNGRIKLMVRGQGSGIITAARRDVFFHKSDVRGAFWELNVGDKVVFELLEDSISGPRAQNVKAARPRKSR